MKLTILKPISTVPAMLVLFAACSSVGEPPTTLLTEAESDLKDAHAMGAEEHAPLVYRSAQNNLNSAKEAIRDEDYKVAKMYLEKSLAESELASAKVYAKQSEVAAKEIEENLDALKQAL